jgi:hypothetical protein
MPRLPLAPDGSIGQWTLVFRGVQLKVEGKPCQAKRERKICALTFKRVKSEGVSTVAIQTDVPLLLSF